MFARRPLKATEQSAVIELRMNMRRLGLKGMFRETFSRTRRIDSLKSLRNSLNFVPWKAQKEVAADLKLIYSAATADEAELRLAEFESKRDEQYKPIIQSLLRNWARVIPFFDYPPEIRKVIYTTSAIESINMSLRKVTKARSSFPTDETAASCFISR
jgi:transposase-like protein